MVWWTGTVRRIFDARRSCRPAMGKITFEIALDGDIEQCRELCDELMAFQKSMAHMEAERFDAMNFDTRMRKSYDSAREKQVIVVKDDDIPVGYVFSTIESVDAMRRSPFKLLPYDVVLPERVGCVNNLYLREGYRSGGLGSQQLSRSMEWLSRFDDIDRVYVFISNGNDDAYRFYQKHGFVYSHDVLGGFIIAACRRIR